MYKLKEMEWKEVKQSNGRMKYKFDTPWMNIVIFDTGDGVYGVSYLRTLFGWGRLPEHGTLEHMKKVARDLVKEYIDYLELFEEQ